MFKFCALALIFICIHGCSDDENKKVQIDNIILKNNSASIKIDQLGYPILYDVIPSNADKSGITFESIDNNIAYVENEKIFAKTVGKTIVIVSDNGNKMGQIEVTTNTFKLYSIGNSHSWDYGPGHNFLSLAESYNVKVSSDYHINCGQNIETILTNPQNTCVDSTYGNYLDAINNEKWDAITIQPFWGHTGAREAEAIKVLIDQIRHSESKDADIFIYYTWPMNTQSQFETFDYSTVWDAEFYEHDEFNNARRGFIDYLKEYLISSNIDIAGYIPVGDTIDTFHTKSKNGEVIDFTGSGQLYRDQLHLNNVGRFIAGAEVFHSIFRHVEMNNNVITSYRPSDSNEYDRDISTQLADDIIKIINN